MRELDCPDTVGGLADAIMTWAATRATAPPLEPVSIYPQTSHGDDGAPRVTDAQRLAEQGTMHRFARDRRTARHGPGGADALRPPACNSWRRRREAELIPKVHERGGLSGLRGLLHYLFGPGKNNERGGRHDNPHVIAAWA